MDLGICTALNEKNIWENLCFQVGIISKLASYFVPTTLFSWSHLEAFDLLSYDCCVVAFRHRISRLNTFVRAFVVFEGGRSLPNDTITPRVSVPILHPREIRLVVMWSQTVRQSKPNNRNKSRYEASEMLTYRVREHNKTGQTIKEKKKKKTNGVVGFKNRSSTRNNVCQSFSSPLQRVVPYILVHDQRSIFQDRITNTPH